jgi:cellulose synthase/poly-beta-1,6-N-acetylglucosamine synthase-like glycosyltransferase
MIPHWALEALGWIFGFGAGATIVIWGYVAFLVEQSIRVVPTLRYGQKLAEAEPPSGRVCVIIPAYNESRVIAGLIRSLRAETYKDLRVVLALDRCTDDTAAIARAEIAADARFETVEVESCPPAWAGKVNAAYTGLTRSRGTKDAEYLLFADADTLFSRGCIAAALALMRAKNLDLLSLLSTLRYDTWFERVVQTATSFELMRQYPLARANAMTNRRAFANGQFLLFRREAYDAIGGHPAVKDAVLEDVALARRIEAAHRPAGLFLAAGLFHCRMYPDWPQFRRGWKRIFIEAANRKAKRLWVSAWRIRGLGTILPAWMFGAGLFGAWVLWHDARIGWTLLALFLVALTIWTGALLRVCALGRAPLWTAPLHIVGAWLTAGILDEAASDVRARRPTRWGGREYDVRDETART